MNHSDTRKHDGEPPTPFPTSQDNPTNKEEALDNGLEETFPASDPVSITTRKPGADTLETPAIGVQGGKEARKKEEDIDKELEATFPASDPVSTTPQKPEKPTS